MLGNLGNDVLLGGAGRDTLSGGPAADRFVFNNLNDSKVGGARDTIINFHHSQGDRIDLYGIDANTSLPGNQAFDVVGADGFSSVAGELRFSTGPALRRSQRQRRARLPPLPCERHLARCLPTSSFRRRLAASHHFGSRSRERHYARAPRLLIVMCGTIFGACHDRALDLRGPHRGLPCRLHRRRCRQRSARRRDQDCDLCGRLLLVDGARLR
ncbi:MAG: hypothetical protein ACREDO_03475 [Methyloceanibacter sp.]